MGTSKVTGLRAKSIVYIDSEIGIDDKRIKDLGAIKDDRSSFHSPSLRDFYAFISGETDILLPFCTTNRNSKAFSIKKVQKNNRASAVRREKKKKIQIGDIIEFFKY
ncbi:MAG: hypothetical protein L6V84_08570 [Oscillospiraceae bacterium]|nr:MAG: hypothetical protein L6V84_08570 [Oscillospiraceae bacterium]